MTEFEHYYCIWDYTPSLNQLLIRCPKTKSQPQNIDWHFMGVDYIDLPTTFTSPTITQPEIEDVMKAEQVLGEEINGRKVFVIEIGGQRHFVVAVGMKVYKNDLSYFETELEGVGSNRNGEQSQDRSFIPQDSLGGMSGRLFQFWNYSISGEQLQIRSIKNAANPRNLELHFFRVEYMDLPTKFTNSTFITPEAEDILKAEKAMGKEVAEKKIFVLSIENRRHIIIATKMRIYEHDLNYDEIELDGYSLNRKSKNRQLF